MFFTTTGSRLVSRDLEEHSALSPKELSRTKAKKTAVRKAVAIMYSYLFCILQSFSLIVYGIEGFSVGGCYQTRDAAHTTGPSVYGQYCTDREWPKNATGQLPSLQKPLSAPWANNAHGMPHASTLRPSLLSLLRKIRMGRPQHQLTHRLAFCKDRGQLLLFCPGRRLSNLTHPGTR